MLKPNDLPLICLPVDLSDEAAAQLIEFLREFTDAELPRLETVDDLEPHRVGHRLAELRLDLESLLAGLHALAFGTIYQYSLFRMTFAMYHFRPRGGGIGGCS